MASDEQQHGGEHSLALSLTTLVEDATRRIFGGLLSGNVSDPSRLFDQHALANLERAHEGVFAFLAFDPRTDHAVLDYVTSGTLAADSGPQLLVLFTVGTVNQEPVNITHDAFDGWVEVTAAGDPSVRLLQDLFDKSPTPSLPGIAFFSNFSATESVVYVPLGGLEDADEVRERLRVLFALAKRAWPGQRKRSKFVNRMARRTRRARIAYARSGRHTVGEWLIDATTALWRSKGEIVAIATQFG